MPEKKNEPNVKQVDFTPERAEQVRKVAVAGVEMLFDLSTGKVFFVGRRKLDINETVMSLTIIDVHNLAAQLLSISVNALAATIEAAALEAAMADSKKNG